MTRRVQEWEPVFDYCNRAQGLPEAETEARFHNVRRWKFDRLYRAQMVAVEIDGGVWSQGRHSRGDGMLKDNEKINTAQTMGYIVLRFTPQQVKDGECWDVIRAALQARGWRGE